MINVGNIRSGFITVILLLLSLNSYSQLSDNLNNDFMLSQDYKPQVSFNVDLNTSINSYHYSEPTIRTGPLMIFGGALLWTTAFLTAPSPTWNGVPSKSPHVKSTPRFVSMVLGGVVFSCGLVVTISGG